MNNDQLVSAWNALGESEQIETLGRALGYAIREEIENVQELATGLDGLGDALPQFLAQKTSEAVGPLIESLGPKVMAIIQPAAERAVEIIRPAIREELAAKIPAFAGITGLTLAAAVIAGLWLGRKLL